MFKRFLFASLFCFLANTISAQSNFTISGYISDSINGEMLIGATVMAKGTGKGTAANVYGFYSLTLPAGTYTIVCSYIGYRTNEFEVTLQADTKTDIKLSNSSVVSKEVVIRADRNQEQVQSTQTSSINIPIDRVKNIPTIGGETDIIKVIQLMPGIKRGGEGQNAIFVRGGSGDDNLMLLDEATVYNVSHLFGFFSVFNNDALKDMTVYKGGFPAQYGGRLSSVMDIRMKDGDMSQYHATGGIGLLSSHITAEGPIVKGKSSFLISGRRSYIDKVMKLAYGENVLPYYFFDANLKLNYTLSDNDRIFFSSYYGDDVLSTKSESDSAFFAGGFKLGNFTVSTRWNHTFNAKLFSNLSLIHTRFRYDVEAQITGNSFLTKSRISDYGIKDDYSYFVSPENTIRYGFSYTLHQFRPNVVSTAGEISDYLASREGTNIYTHELGLYYNQELSLDSGLYKINYGFRLSALGTTDKFYVSPEPRVSGTWNYVRTQSFKLSYSRMTQYLHLVSSSSVALPTDLWYPVTKNVKPLYADQIAVAWNYNAEKIGTLFTVEAYYKWMQNLIEYREGAVLVLNDNYENELVHGKGKAYGFEFFAQRMEGKLTGWVGYTLSWSVRQFDELNQGKPFFAKFDRRHDISVVLMYEFTKRVSLSAVWVFSTGQRFTPVNGNFLMPDATLTQVNILPIYTDKNAIQLPAAHRLDINLVIKSRLDRKWLKWTGEWAIGAYNFYNRAQPYKIQIVDDGNGGFKYQAVGLFGFIPSVAYSFKF
jgi:CarboxypepD_reg-like domain/TonB-dependent Receptor Plug Domain